MDAAKIDEWLASLDEIGTRIGFLVGELLEAGDIERSPDVRNNLETCLDSMTTAIDYLVAADKNLRTLR